MPNPPFQPLTLSVEEWNDCTLRGRPWMIKKLKEEVSAQSHRADEWQAIAEGRAKLIDREREEAASLRQRLEEKDKEATKELIELVREVTNMRAHRDELLEKLDQSEARASQAEAALKEMQKKEELLKAANELLYSYVQMFIDSGAALEGKPVDEVLAELQRRRSRPAEER